MVPRLYPKELADLVWNGNLALAGNASLFLHKRQFLTSLYRSLLSENGTEVSGFGGSDECMRQRYNFAFRSRSALVITETLLKLMAAAAKIGLSRIPKNGYSTPAAMGTPIAL